jgi:lysophospholipase L1-like esterase
MKTAILRAGLLLVPAFLHAQQPVTAQASDPDPARFAASIESFQRWDAKNSTPQDPVLFVGSSSIVGWNTSERFPDLPVVNRGFGGSHISDVNHYIEETVLRYRPSLVIFYAGDNDVEAGKTSEQVLEDYQEFVDALFEAVPSTEVVFIPIKPSLARWNLWPEMKKANALIAAYSSSDDRLHYVDLATPMLGADGTPRPELFVDDGLHLTPAGYDLWTERLAEFLDSDRR